MPNFAACVRRLCTGLLMVCLTIWRAPAAAQDDVEMLALTQQTLKFEPIPNMPSCATAAIVQGNPVLGPAWVYLKLASGCRVPRHWHTANEHMVVISGKGSIAMTGGPTLPIVPGAFASLPSRHTHQASCEHTCLFFNMADAAFDIHYVDANGDDIPLEAAMKTIAKSKKGKK